MHLRTFVCTFFLWTCVFSYYGYIPRIGTAGSYGNSLFNFKELPNCFPKQLYHFRFNHPHQNLLSDFLIIAFLVSVKWYSRMVLICISLMINDIKHLFMSLLTTCISFLEKCLFKSVLVLLGCYNKILQTGWLISSRNLLLIDLEKAPAWLNSGEGPLPGSWFVPSHCVLTWWKRLGNSLELLLEGTNPIHEGSTLMT